MALEWQLCLLGPPRLVAPDGREVRCEGRPLALLAYLALEGPAPRSRLAGLLWPERTEDGARNNLVQLTRRMARSFGEELVVGQDLLGLAATVSVDARALLDGQLAPVPDGALLDGETFAGTQDLADWLLVQRERIDAARAHLLGLAARHHEEQGDFAQAAQLTRRVLSVDRMSEEAHRSLMRQLYLSGEPAGALEVYRQLCATLTRELHTEPMPETQELARQIDQGSHAPAPARPAASVPLAALRPAPLTGRAQEWAAMEEGWQAGQFLIVSGEPGMGKSRLAADFAASKGRVLTLEARPGDRLAPYSTTARSLRRALEFSGAELPLPERRVLSWLLPELTPPGEVPPAQADPSLQQVIRAAFGVTLQGVDAYLFDDMQYADDASIEAGFVLIDAMFPLGQPGGLPHFIAVHRRDDLPPFTAQIFARLMNAGQARRVELGPLPDPAVRALIGQLGVSLAPERVAHLARASGGNALFVLESVKSLLEAGGDAAESSAVPARVKEVIAARLARLPKMALQAARAAAVLQRDFGPDLVAEVLGAPLLEVVAAWDDLEGAQIMQGERFHHDLVQEAVLAHTPATVRRLLHRSAARVLARQAHAPAQIAQHWLDGGEQREAVPWLLRAGAAAGAARRHPEAAAFFERAARLLDDAGSDEAFDAWEQGARARAHTADREAHQHAVNALHERAQGPRQTARAWQVQAELFAAQAQGAQAARAARRGLAALGDLNDPQLRAGLRAVLPGE
ncbi:BTAD domain-containing putative transcriptional regulator [Deinococcus sonorensis]|uniref:BTAD domain-containing putative transcriptional regulator n=2 Tax=Deinococcus sonorensis TaxID=309891 RepID=A0AAU7U6E0_9DEIO